MCKIAIVTLYTPEIVELGVTTSESKRSYAERHGYACIVSTETLDSSRPPSWSKILMLLRAMSECYDWVFWSDADSVITNQSIPLTRWTDDTVDLIACRDHPNGTTGHGINAGELLVRGCQESWDFLESVWNQTQCLTHPWWEQEAINHLLRHGHSIKHKILNPKEFNSFAPKIIDGWKSWGHKDTGIQSLCMWTPGDFICHMPTMSYADRMKFIQENL